MKIGLDIGSTTIKSVVVDDNGTVLFRSYERHFSQITQKTAELLQTVGDIVPVHHSTEVTISGSAGMGLAESCGIPFVQEVYATRIAANRLSPGTDVVIELGGEDAKILFLSGGMEVRMNGSCAGGTGAFIDQMATLLNVPLEEIDDLAKKHEKLYTIASRCGVFAKSDIQPLLNQGAQKSDIAASIFGAVVNQTIAGLAQGRPITGNILYLGGPLTFLSHLRKSFDETLHTTGICPEDSLYYVALGAAYASDTAVDLNKAIEKLNNYHASEHYATINPLFESKEDYERFEQRHAKHNVLQADPASYTGKAYLGLDAGSTTVKAVILGENGQLLASSYQPNNGNPVPIIRAFLLNFYEQYPQIALTGATVTGYGEEIIKNAFRADNGIVETVAHFTAAKNFMPDVEFIIDIGGQDIKCFKIRNGAIDNIFLNEACSSGCGSFLQTFANALGYSIEEFAKLGLFADHPVDLGSRCTVFMNSSVKQAQKDGASIENISAGLSISVVKNALYKVIRAASAEELGRHIVVQGGTFLNDAVLRAFEQELKIDAVRPGIAGLMGAFGAALYSKKHSNGSSTLLNKQELIDFTHEVTNVNCGLCNNNCQLTVNRFDSGRRYISGNRCERPITQKATDNSLNIYDYKYKLLQEYTPGEAKRGTIGIPMGLNMYELLPFWHTFFTSLGIRVVTSPASSRELYLNGQSTIPSDTVCFPAKLLHGHVQQLIDNGITTIFYPCLTYNIDEGLGDNHYNCPVVAYYPEVITSNMPAVKKLTFIKDYIGIHRPKDFPGKMHKILAQYFDGITLKEVETASKNAYKAYEGFFKSIRAQGARIMAQAEKENRQIIVLAGRPYHIDPEINHGIDRLIAGFGVAIISEDCISNEVQRFKTSVLNQWTYHSRLYAAARYIADKPNMNLVQLVSFGCGVDAITTDEVREILEHEGRIYTQIKIDEITNLGAVKIRLRSLFAATQEQ